jgi:signal transduction histidine kinase
MERERPGHLVSLYDHCIVEETTSMLRHDLGNKIGAVRNAAFYIQKKVKTESEPGSATDSRITRMLDIIGSELAATDALVSSRWPRRGEHTEAADCDAAIRELLTHLSPLAASRIDVITNSDGAVPLSTLELQLAMYCLIENAVDACSDGRIRLAIRAHQDGRLAIDVIDDGPGFVGEAATRHLEPFFTTRPGRVGLGLNIARRIAYRGDGSLTIEARSRSGVIATLLLPRG